MKNKLITTVSALFRAQQLVTDARFLKMLNPSVGVWHLEGVERECSTVEQAINWRAGSLKVGVWQPEILT